MSILADKNTRLIVQGITGREGDFHARAMHKHAPIVVGGVTPGKGGLQLDYDGDKIPVFDTVGQAARETGANATVIYVPAKFAPDAMMEAADAGLKFICCITEGVPVLDMIKVRAYLDAKGATLLGPNCPGLITPGQAKIGIIPANICTPGSIGIVSRSGTLTYEAIAALTQNGFGQSTVVGIGGDPVRGLDFLQVIQKFNEDPQTEAIIMIGEIGGSDEEKAAAWAKAHVKKPMVGFIAGRAAPEGKRMGHAGAIIEGGMGTAASKVEAMEAAGITVADLPTQFPDLLKMRLSKARKTVAVKRAAKPAVKKPAAKKAAAKKPAVKKPAARKAAAKPAARKPAVRKPARKSGR
ncbi:MAG: succinate--CoA ligase subunit alpha [Thermoflexales bacterium]|nr:succinate--CoA ligase subunit alpha [Thermoflexales bacterium]